MRPDPPSPGNAMAAKTTPQKAKRKDASKTSKANAPTAAASALSMVVAQNLINMVVVSAVSAAVLLGLSAARHF
jgi:hypothetical protein